MPDALPKRIVVGISGASGAVIGVALLKALRATAGCETHLIVSASAQLTVSQELGLTRAELDAHADVVHNVRNIGATVASGSFLTHAMVIAPCSMKTLASVANGFSDNLIARAADVTLKERRRLILVTREAPLNLAHLRNMVSVTEMGAIILPPVPAFYARPQSIDDIVNQVVQHIFDLLDLAPATPAQRWNGLHGEVISSDSSPAKT